MKKKRGRPAIKGRADWRTVFTIRFTKTMNSTIAELAKRAGAISPGKVTKTHVVLRALYHGLPLVAEEFGMTLEMIRKFKYK